MIFTEHGDRNAPTVILLHGGGLSDWSWEKVIQGLGRSYHIVTPILDGHGRAGAEPFTSIEDSARKLAEYIDRSYGGKVFAIGGLSIGAQIVVEALSQRADIARYAILESALVYPIRGTAVLAACSSRWLYGLIRKRWFSKLQAKALYLPEEWFEAYYQDSLRISQETLRNMTLSNGSYSLKSTIENTTAKALIVVGEKEIGVMRKSARLLRERIPGSELYVAQGLRHGELSLGNPQRYVELVSAFMG